MQEILTLYPDGSEISAFDPPHGQMNDWYVFSFHTFQGSSQTYKDQLINLFLKNSSMHQLLSQLQNLIVHCSSDKTQAEVMPTERHFKNRHFWQLRRLSKLTWIFVLYVSGVVD